MLILLYLGIIFVICYPFFTYLLTTCFNRY